MITERDRAQSPAMSLAVPAARVEGLITTSSDDEVLVYDQERHHIHHLNHSAAAVWRLCDGRRSVEDIARAASEQDTEPVDADAVRLAIDKLARADLLVAAVPDAFQLSTHSRRTFMKRAAVAGAVAVPAIVSMTAPARAANSKGCGTLCNPGGLGSNGNCPGAGIGFQCNHCWINGIVTDTNGTGNCNNVTSSDPCYCGCPPTQLVNGVCPGQTSPPPPPPPPPLAPLTNQSQSLAPQSQMAPTNTPTPEATQPPAPQATEPPLLQATEPPPPPQATEAAPPPQATEPPVPTDTPVPPPPPPAAPDNSAPTGGNPNTAGSTVVPNPFGDGNGNSGNNGNGGG